VVEVVAVVHPATMKMMIAAEAAVDVVVHPVMMTMMIVVVVE